MERWRSFWSSKRLYCADGADDLEQPAFGGRCRQLAQANRHHANHAELAGRGHDRHAGVFSPRIKGLHCHAVLLLRHPVPDNRLAAIQGVRRAYH